MRATVCFVAGAGLVVAGCGSADRAAPTPFKTPPTITWVELSGPAPAHTWVCVTEISSAPGPVSARVAPVSYYIQLHAGDCSAPDSLVAESNSGTFTIVVPLGRYHVKVGNPTDEAGGYFVRIEFPLS